MQAPQAAGDEPLRGARAPRRRHLRLRLGLRERLRRPGDLRAQLLEGDVEPRPLGARGPQRLEDQDSQGPQGQAHLDRGDRPRQALPQEARRQGRRRVQLGRDRSEGPRARRRDRRPHGDRFLAPREQPPHRRHDPHVHHPLHRQQEELEERREAREARAAQDAPHGRSRGAEARPSQVQRAREDAR